MAEELRRYAVGARKIPHKDRDVAHKAFRENSRRHYRSIIGADSDDDDKKFPVGSNVTYSIDLTEAEAAEFAAASNARYVELDGFATPDRAVGRPTGAPHVPSLATLASMRMRYLNLRQWHGRDVPVAVLDQGTTKAIRDRMGYTLVAKTVVSNVVLDGRDLYRPDHQHGCWVAPNAVPAGGLLLDCIVSGTDGRGQYTDMASGITWATDNGAKVANLSFSGAIGDTSQAISDAVAYAANAGMQVVMSAGNDGNPDLNFPSSLSRTNSNVHSSIAWDESTDRRALFSCYNADGSGCAPGVDVNSLDIYGNLTTWNGTSASSPHMAQLIARGCTGGTYTPSQVAAALRANTRDTGAAAAQQGAGAWDLQRALAALGAAPSTASSAGSSSPSYIDVSGAAGLYNGYNFGFASGLTVDDLQLAVSFASSNSSMVAPGWTELTNLGYMAAYEQAAGTTVGPTRVRVYSRPATVDQPYPLSFSYGSVWYSAMCMLTLRSPGGIDSERLVPIPKFGIGGNLDTVPVLPSTTNDMLVCLFAQRHPSGATGTLSLPTGLTQRGFWRPASGTTGTGYILLLATAQLTSSARTPAYVSASNDSTGTWSTVAFTVPANDPALATVTQSEPVGAAEAFMPFFRGA